MATKEMYKFSRKKQKSKYEISGPASFTYKEEYQYVEEPDIIDIIPNNKKSTSEHTNNKSIIKKLSNRFLQRSKSADEITNHNNNNNIELKTSVARESSNLSSDNEFGSEKKKKRSKPLLFRKKSNGEAYKEAASKAHISGPSNFGHTLHVDFDFKWWTGSTDPNQIFELKRKLGEGTYGKVYEAKHKDSGFILACKIVHVRRKQMENVRKEIEILKICKSPYIIQYYGSCYKNRDLWILMDVMKGSIKDILDKFKKTFKESEIAGVCSYTLRGLDYLHKLSVIHRDVKCANILFDSRADIILADFGIAIRVDESNDDFIGTPLWMAPEVISGKKYDFRVDIYSLGICAIEMAQGNPPYSDLRPMTARTKICEGPSPKLTEPEKWSLEFNEFIALCLDKNPDKRPDAGQLLQHAFIQKADHNSLKELISAYLKNENNHGKVDDKKKVKQTEEERLQQEKLDLLLNMVDKEGDESFSFKVQMPYFLDSKNDNKSQTKNNIDTDHKIENNATLDTTVPSQETKNQEHKQHDIINDCKIL